MAHVAEYKKKVVKNIVDLSSQYPIIGAVNMENLPAPQLQKMRAHLRDKIKFAMTKKRLIKIALEQIKGSKKDIEKLKEHFIGMPALIFTKENPFKLFKMLKKNKSAAPAKAGQVAPKDIVVPAGPTSFAPGPIIGELGQIGIKTGVEGGKVAVKEDSVVAKRGEKIKPKVAEILTRLGIEPMEVGLDLVATYEDGTIYSKDILDVDEDKFMADLRGCASGAFNVAMFVAYPTKDTVEHLISKAFNDSKALGLSENIIDEGVIDDLLGKAHRQMMGLSSTANIEVKEEPKKEEAKPEEKEAPKEEKKPEPKPEVKKEEPKPEVKEEKKEEAKPEVQAPKVEEKPKEDEEKKKAEEAKEEERKKAEKKAREEKLRKKLEEEKEKTEELKKEVEEETQKEQEEKKKVEDAEEKEKKKAEKKAREEELRKKLEEEKRETEKLKKEVEEEEKHLEQIEEQKKAEEAKKAEELKRKEEEQKKQEEVRKQKEFEEKKQEEIKKQEEAKKAEEAKKQEEQRRIEEQKKVEEEKERQESEKRKIEEQKKKEASTTEDRVKEMVEKTKKMAQGPGPSAADILEKVGREQPKKPEIKKEEPKKEVKEELPETERLMKELQKKGTLRGVRTEGTEKKKPEVKKGQKDDEQKKVEDLVEQLKRKGTLRK